LEIASLSVIEVEKMPPKQKKSKSQEVRLEVEVHKSSRDLEDAPSDDGADRRVSKRARSRSKHYPQETYESPVRKGYAKVCLQIVKL
jgi:hypothetical protein